MNGDDWCEYEGGTSQVLAPFVDIRATGFNFGASVSECVAGMLAKGF